MVISTHRGYTITTLPGFCARAKAKGFTHQIIGHGTRLFAAGISDARTIVAESLQHHRYWDRPVVSASLNRHFHQTVKQCASVK